GQHGDAQKRAVPGVDDARIEQSGAGQGEQGGKQRVKRYSERQLTVGLAPAQDEQRDTDEQQEEPEDRRRELDHGLEAATGNGAECEQQKRNGTLNEKAVDRRFRARIPACQTLEQRDI